MRLPSFLILIVALTVSFVVLHACSQKDIAAVQQGHAAATQAVDAAQAAAGALPPSPVKDGILFELNRIETYLTAVGVLLGALAAFQTKAKKALQQDFDAVVESVEDNLPTRTETQKDLLSVAQGERASRRVHEAKGRLGL